MVNMNRWSPYEFSFVMGVLTVCIIFIAWTINGITNPGPHVPGEDEVYQKACLKKGGIPNTRITSDRWSCEVKK